jgi:UDP-glucose 4-epimerase
MKIAIAGIGYSVLQILKAFEQASGKKIPYEIVAGREGDIGECYASTVYA